MKVFEIREKGIENLFMVERPQPEPGYHQVLVEVKAVSLNYRDLLLIRGGANVGRIPTSDCAGRVAAVGNGVSRFMPGDRVTPIFTQGWLAGRTAPQGAAALGGPIDGVLAEYVLIDESGLVKAPDHLSYEEAAAFPCAGVTAWHALVTAGGLAAGQTVLVQGTGGVSIFALQFARMTGARVLATSGTESKLERLRELGAPDVVNYKSRPDWDQWAREVTGGSGVDYIVEVGGAGTLSRSLQAIKVGGRICVIGLLSGGGEIDPMPILRRNAVVYGISVGSREMFEAMNRAVTLHQMHPVIDRVFPFERAVDALHHLESGVHFGKVCIRIG